MNAVNLEENKITVSIHNGRLSKDESGCMKKDAQIYPVENGMQMQTIASKYFLRSYCFNTKSAVENEKLIEKISESDKNNILDQCNEFIPF
jgi:L1 cell adhesion molecule like protein